MQSFRRIYGEKCNQLEEPIGRSAINRKNKIVSKPNWLTKQPNWDHLTHQTTKLWDQTNKLIVNTILTRPTTEQFEPNKSKSNWTKTNQTKTNMREINNQLTDIDQTTINQIILKNDTNHIKYKEKKQYDGLDTNHKT